MQPNSLRLADIGGEIMIRLSDCDDCKHCTGFEHGHALCDAFPDGIPYNHMDKNLTDCKDCNNGIGFEPKDESDKTTQ